ncbi:unnamed protein product [Plutella xylostella]|uniref:(diamondback moth) hypothetical protein n=1 Tax=Plutella xylostella TaxID=51655 RepID=A0A8S4FUW2_PLUXY|nr:unnamed protein product [Plutella xylostella]
MPDTLSLTTGVSLGLLAGIVSGVCYIFANGLNKPRPDSADGRQYHIRLHRTEGRQTQFVTRIANRC